MTREPYVPVIILGAGRSGTNALRDTLVQLPEFSTWDCDEINPIWRHGNINWPNDEIPPERATPKVKKFIRRAFDKIWRRSGKPAFIVEKTCANTLRVPFVDSTFPNAKYIHIVRSGIDVVASARKRWRGDLEVPGLPYFASKALNTPVTDLPIYAYRFVKSRIGLLLGRKETLSAWGPRFDGLEELKNAHIEEICARQWVECVSKTSAALENIEPSRVIKVRYEDFVSNPREVLSEILLFLQFEFTDAQLKYATRKINSRSVGKGKTVQSEIKPQLMEVMKAHLKAHGYGKQK